MKTDFQDYGRTLTNVAYLKYLDCLLAVMDDNWPSLVSNLWNAHIKWSHMSWILG